jgi:putative tryptophan/tyrosine transport system substrate-binding protein
MRRIGLAMIVTLGFTVVSLDAEGQRSSKLPRIGVLAVGGGPPTVIEAFVSGLRDLGWVDGKNVVIERRVAEGREDRLPALAAELTDLKVDVILAAGGPASLNAARDATKTIPIVMVASSRDPIGNGLIKSYARPGGNITGLVTAPEELTGKQLELLRDVRPGLSRVGILWDATTGRVRLEHETVTVAQTLGIELRSFELRGPTDFASAVTAATKERVGGVLFPGSPMFVRNRTQIAALLIEHRLPAISVWGSFTEAGVLLAYGPSLPDLFHRAAGYVDKILRGANPADIPVERPTKFMLVINMKTAKALKLTIPQTLLLRADQVIE